MKMKPIIGILGGIGSGKSSVAEAFAALGCAVIDADVIAHQVLNEPQVSAKLTERWGAEVLDANGTVCRRRIAKKVFGVQEEIDFLNGLVHPQVLKQSDAMIKAYQADATICGIVLDMPLLLEVGWEKKCDFLVFVDCSEEKRRARIAKNGKIDLEQLKKREKFQISLDKKRQKAHYTVSNNSDKSEIAEQVAHIFSIMMGNK